MTLLPESRSKLEAPFAFLAAQLLAAAKNRSIIFMQNHGNYGDALIRYGTLQFFEDLKLNFKEFDMSSRRKTLACNLTGLLDRATDRYLFVYSGNGAWGPSYDLAFKNITRQRRFTKNLFILPATYDKYSFDFDFPVFARDQFQSQAFLKGAPFCHDMAFYLALLSPDRMLTNRLPPTTKTGFMLRNDRESLGHSMQSWPENFDLSASGSHKSNPQAFLRYIDRFEHIVTDRLHVAIGGVLLDKKITLLNGNYFKIKAIYNSSIVGLFDRVEFIENSSERFIQECALLALQQANEDLFTSVNTTDTLSESKQA